MHLHALRVGVFRNSNDFFLGYDCSVKSVLQCNHCCRRKVDVIADDYTGFDIFQGEMVPLIK